MPNVRASINAFLKWNQTNCIRFMPFIRFQHSRRCVWEEKSVWDLYRLHVMRTMLRSLMQYVFAINWLIMKCVHSICYVCVCVFFYSFILHWICLFLFIYLPFCKCSISAQHIYEIAFFAIESKAFLSVWSLEWMEEKTSFCERNFKWKIQTDKWLKHQHHRCTIRKKEKRFQFVKIFRNCCTWKET